MSIGSVIRRARKALNLTLEAVAHEAGTDASNLSRIERGVQQPSIELLQLIAQTIQVPVSVLFAEVEYGAENTPPRSTEEYVHELAGKVASKQQTHLCQGFQRLSSEHQGLVLALVDALNTTAKLPRSPSSAHE